MESISSNKSFWSQEVFDRSGSQRALTRAPDRKKFMIDRRSIGELMSSNKSSWSPKFLIDWGLNELWWELPIAKRVLLYEGPNEL